MELGGHKSNHDYMIVDTPSMCLLSEDWTADEELRLLESLEKFGYGNWEAAAEHVGNGRTRLACERHYAPYGERGGETTRGAPCAESEFVYYPT